MGSTNPDVYESANPSSVPTVDDTGPGAEVVGRISRSSEGRTVDLVTPPEGCRSAGEERCTLPACGDDPFSLVASC